MRFLITGGAGFIGSALVRLILKNTKHSVVNIDKLTYAGNLESLTEVENSERYSLEIADICDQVRLDQIFIEHQPDAVIHLAAESHVDRSIDNPYAFIETNVVGTYKLLEAANSYFMTLDTPRREAFRFLHVSTDEVYGDLACEGAELDLSDRDLFTEATSYAPSSPYAASKAGSDHLARAWYRTYGLPVIVTNCSNNYGPYQFPEKLLPLMILNVLDGKTLPIYGKGDQIRDWLFVEDHARALLEVVTRGRVGETYNIGGHNELQNIEVVRIVCDILQELVPSQNCYRNLIVHVKDRPGHDRRYAIDASKIQRELGWYPSETFATGIRKTVQWYLANLDWCHHVQDGSYRRERLGQL